VRLLRGGRGPQGDRTAAPTPHRSNGRRTAMTDRLILSLPAPCPAPANDIECDTDKVVAPTRFRGRCYARLLGEVFDELFGEVPAGLADRSYFPADAPVVNGSRKLTHIRHGGLAVSTDGRNTSRDPWGVVSPTTFLRAPT
jgi:hypothetical protein